VSTNREKLSKADEDIIDLEEKSALAIQQVADLKHEMQTRLNDIAKEQRHKEKLEKDLKQCQSEYEVKLNETKV